MKQLNVYGDMQKTNALIKEFITGYEGNLTKEEEDTIKMMKDSGAHQLDLDKVRNTWVFSPLVPSKREKNMLVLLS